jgi:hypothetical protein
MKSARFGFLLLSAVVLPFAVQAGELPFLTPEEAVSMAITPRNNVKNTLNKAVPAEVAGLNRAFSSRTTWVKRDRVLKENNMSAADLYRSDTNVSVSCDPTRGCITANPGTPSRLENSDRNTAQALKMTEQYPLVADTPEAVSGKIINILDLNNQPEDFIHLLQPQEDEEETAEENQENTEEEEKENKEKADKTSENNIETVAETVPETNRGTEEKIKEEDDGVKHISVRRRFGQ